MDAEITAMVYTCQIGGKRHYQPCLTDRHGEKWQGKLTDDRDAAVAELRQKLYLTYECVQ